MITGVGTPKTARLSSVLYQTMCRVQGTLDYITQWSSGIAWNQGVCGLSHVAACFSLVRKRKGLILSSKDQRSRSGWLPIIAAVAGNQILSCGSISVKGIRVRCQCPDAKSRRRRQSLLRCEVEHQKSNWKSSNYSFHILPSISADWMRRDALRFSLQ